MIHHGDCLEVMAGMEPESIDAIVTDPPYGLEFMGKQWDRLDTRTRGGSVGRAGHKDGTLAPIEYGAGKDRSTFQCGCGKRDKFKNPHSCENPTWTRVTLPADRSYATTMQAWHQQWAEAAYRVAKPSAYLLAFGGTRTVHRMTVALEDAGWIIRDMLVWAYASGFPKSKASLKPAWEPIVMARKPGPLRMLAIDECRIPGADPANYPADRGVAGRSTTEDWRMQPGSMNAAGRWPANVILTDPIFDGDTEGVVGGGEQSGGGNPARRSPENITAQRNAYGGGWSGGDTYAEPFDTSGTYSRFFLIPKADRADREPVLGGQTTTELHLNGAFAVICAKCNRQRVNVPGAACKCEEPEWVRKSQKPRANVHPTVKPTELMRHLVRLVTPTGGIVLDPFLGSGTTAIAAELEGFPWIGIEREAEYVAIAEARLNGTQRGLGLSA